MISVGQTINYGNKAQSKFICKCGSNTFWHSTGLNYLKVGFLSLVPLNEVKVLKCCKCQRTHEPENCHTQHFSRSSILTKLSKTTGWPFIIALGAMVHFFYNSINPDDSEFRSQPRLGDIYFVDLHRITQNDKHSTHPYRLAKLVSFSDDELELKISGWSHSRKVGVLTDFSTQRHAYKSNYMENTITLAKDALAYREHVFSIRRKNSYADVEELQKAVAFEKEFLDFPYL